MTVKSELHELVEALDEAHEAKALHYLRLLTSNGDILPAEVLEFARRTDEEIARGVYGKRGRPTSEDDPLWNIVGMVGDEYDGPTDVASNKHKYLAEAYVDLHEE